jgi:predicted RNA-binding Zn-ribbon protein involved in translation (DUF1610 family)
MRSGFESRKGWPCVGFDSPPMHGNLYMRLKNAHGHTIFKYGSRKIYNRTTARSSQDQFFLQRSVSQTWTFPKSASWTWLKSKIIKLGVDTSHFLGKAAHAGSRNKGKAAKHSASKILVEGKCQRERTHRLRRALLELGRVHECKDCGNKGEWNGKKLVLEIDHKNGDWSDCRESNLDFVCPNCHSTRTYSPDESR